MYSKTFFKKIGALGPPFVAAPVDGIFAKDLRKIHEKLKQGTELKDTPPAFKTL